MSNRIVPQVYRAIIDEVMANIKGEFEEFGVDDDKWETKVVASNVAQFEPPAAASPPARHPPIHPTHPHPPPPPQPQYHPHHPPPAPGPRVKTEEDDTVPRHGTFAPGGIQLTRVPQVDGEASGKKGGVDGWDELAETPRPRKFSPLEEYMKTLTMPQAGPSRISQVDGSSDIDPASPPLQTLDDGRGTEEIG
ncbi:hypothetical protein RSAG8_11529, partial [Rhizoctonia solani AG-8 WAC10335]